jgi:hypothetical protein
MNSKEDSKSINEELCKLKSLYDNELKDYIKTNYVPFFVRMTKDYDGKDGVLFVGKAENMEDKDNVIIDKAFSKAMEDKDVIIGEAFSKAHEWINPDTFTKKPTEKAARSAYNRVVYKITSFLKTNKNINHFARTNLYKLAHTKDYKFGSNYEKANFDIFKKEIELLNPKFVIMLTSGLEKPFLEELVEKHNKHILRKVDFQYQNKGNKQTKEIECVKFDGLESIFITAFHPQGKPEKELVRIIKELISNTIQP